MKFSFRDLKFKEYICYFFLLILIFICFYFRFKNLNLWGLSGDEIVTAEAPNFNDARCFIYAFIINNFARAVIFVTGNSFVSETLLRTPSAIAALVTVPILWCIGKKLKDEFTSLILITFFTFSFYLIGYARDARYYSFYFLASCLIIYSIIKVITFYNEKGKLYLWLFLYSLSMVFCMGIHQGSYLFYALSNIYLSILFILSFLISFKTKRSKTSVTDLIIKFALICIPLFVVSGLLFKMSKGELDNNLNNSDSLLPSISWNSLKTIQITFYQLFPFANILLLLASIFPIYLVFRKKFTLFSLYCLFVKYGTFIFLHFLPQAVVKEPFREKYILYIFSIDLVILSLGISSLIYDISTILSLAFKKYSRVISDTIYSAIVYGILIWFGLDMFNNIFDSKIYYQRNQTIRKIAERLDHVGSNDIIIVFGKYGGRNVVLDYEKKRLSSRNNWKWFSNPTSYKSIVPAENSGYIWYVFLGDYLDSNGYVDLVFQETDFSIYKSKKEISNDIEKIAMLTSELLSKTGSSNFKYACFINNTKHLNNAILTELYSESNNTRKFLNENLLLNGNFNEKGKHWNISKSLVDNEDYAFNKDDKDAFASLTYHPGKQVGLSQNFMVVSGQCYKVSAICRNNEKYNGDLLNAYIVVYQPNDKKGQYLSFYDSYHNWTEKSMIFCPSSTGSALIQYRNGYANLPHATIADCKEIKIQRCIDIDFDNNLLHNGVFTNQFNSWTIVKNDNDIQIETESNSFTNALKMSCLNGKTIRISQSFNVVSGAVYNIFFCAKKIDDGNKSGALLILGGLEFDVKKEKYLFMRDLSSSWSYQYLSLKAKRTGDATLYLMAGKDNINEIVYFKDIIINKK